MNVNHACINRTTHTCAFAAIVWFLAASASSWAACKSFRAFSSWWRVSLVSAAVRATSARERASTSAIYIHFALVPFLLQGPGVDTSPEGYENGN